MSTCALRSLLPLEGYGDKGVVQGGGEQFRQLVTGGSMDDMMELETTLLPGNQQFLSVFPGQLRPETRGHVSMCDLIGIKLITSK